MFNLKRKRSLKSSAFAVFDEAANTSLLVIASILFPTVLISLVYCLMFGVWPWEECEVYAIQKDLFEFYAWCSISYLIAIVIAWAGGITRITKIVCLIMFLMVTNNLLMALDAMNLMTRDVLETIDDYIQLMCGLAFMCIGGLCLTAKLWRYVSRYSLLPFGS